VPTLGCKFEQKPDIRLRQSYAKGIPDSSQKYRAHQAHAAWSSSSKGYKEIPEFAHRNAGVAIIMKNALLLCRTHKPDWSSIAKPHSAVGEADRIIDRILRHVVDPDLRDEDETAPPIKVIQETVRLIRGAEKVLDGMPPGQVSTFYGEINVAWRNGDRIVRLACFPERPSVIQSGSLSLPLGSYRSEENPTPELLANRINSLGH
jgi:hypothetical protein